MTFVDEKEVHVESHMREGHPVRDYWRSRPGHKSGIVEEKHKSIMEILFPGPICFPDAQKEPEGLVMNGAEDVLTGGVEVIVGLPEMILEALKNAGEAAGEVLSAMSPYALKALKIAAALKARQAQAGAAYGSEMPINYTPDGAIRGNVALDYARKNPYTPYEPIDPKELLQVTDIQGQGARGAGLLQKRLLQANSFRNAQSSSPNNTKFADSMGQTCQNLNQWHNVNEYNANEIPYYLQSDPLQNQKILSIITDNIKKAFNDSKYKLKGYADTEARNLLKYMMSEKAYNKFGPFLNEHPNINLFLLNGFAEAAKTTNIMNSRHSAQILKSALDFDKNASKIPNTFIVKSYKELEPLSEFIKEKLISQNMDPDMSPGIVHVFDSDLSQDISMSNEVKEFAKENLKALNNGQIVTNKSLTFDSTSNLSTSIHRADVLMAYYDRNGDLVMVILDTNDYNKGEKKLLVYMGYLAQTKGDLDGFFNLLLIKIPKDSF